MSSADLLGRRLDEVIELFDSLRDERIGRAVTAITDAMVTCLRDGGRVLLCGNGGSAADAQHLAAELVGRFVLDRRPFAGIALADNVAALTAIGNDYSYEDVFQRGVRGIGRPGDVVFGLSTSGGSRNVVKALEAAREGGMVAVAFVGVDGSPMTQVADHVIAVGDAATARVQEAHKFLGHTIFEAVEAQLCG